MVARTLPETHVSPADEFAERTGSISWSGVFAGALAGLAVAVVLSTLGVAIGITAGATLPIRPSAGEEARGIDPDTYMGFGVAGTIWILLTVVLGGAD